MADRRNAVFMLGALFLLVLALAGCQPVQPVPPTPVPELLFTQAAQTFVAEMTQTAAQGQNGEAATPTVPPAAETESTVETDTPTAGPSATTAPSDTPVSSDTPVPTETPQVTPTPTRVPNAILEDDFSDDDKWFTAEEDEFVIEYTEDEAYRIRVNLLNAAIWSIRTGDYENVRLEVDAARTAGPENGYYGLICRHQDEDHYYAFLLNTTGGYGIAKMKDGVFEFLVNGTAAAEDVHMGTAVNRVGAECIGSRLALYSNGKLLVETNDREYESGSVGVVAKSQLQEGFEATFDNFAIIQP